MTDCPPPMVLMETVALPNQDGSLLVVSTADTETRLVVASYDQRVDKTEATVAGELELTNRRTKPATMRYQWRRRIDQRVRPWLPDDSPICYDWERSMLVVQLDQRVEAGELVMVDLDWTVDLHPDADINRDGKVDGGDQGALFSMWSSSNQAGDLNRDGTVDGKDLGLLLEAWKGS